MSSSWLFQEALKAMLVTESAITRSAGIVVFILRDYRLMFVTHIPSEIPKSTQKPLFATSKPGAVASKSPATGSCMRQNFILIPKELVESKGICG
jgi:hypothetical protein